MDLIRRTTSSHQELGFLPVLVAAVLVFAVSPVLADSDLGLAVLNLLAFPVLLGALRASGVTGRLFRVAAGVGGVAALLAVLDAAAGVEVLSGPGTVVTYGLWGVAPIAVLARVIRDRQVTLNTIYGAVTAYFLFGMLMGFQYAALEEIESGSFAFAGGEKDSYTGDLLYYSLVTQTTLGFGDITPVKAIPRTLSVIHAVVGQVYLVVVVARLVALQLTHTSEQGERG